MADAAEKAFIAFINSNHAAAQPDHQHAGPSHLPLGSAAAADPHTHTSSSPPAPASPGSVSASLSNRADPTASTPTEISGPQSKAALEHTAFLPAATGSETSTQGSAAFPASAVGTEASPGTATDFGASPAAATGLLIPDAEEASSSTAAAEAWATPPVELTVKHVGFLGSLAHALVHLHQPAQGLALLRAAASVMRTNPHSPPHWFQGSPDPRTLHAHVLMDLVFALTGMDVSCMMLTVSKYDNMAIPLSP